MNKFNWDLINQPNTVVHCETEQQAIELLTEVHNNGFKWLSGNEYLKCSTYYRTYGCETCYYIYNGSFADIQFYTEKGYKILKFEECKLMNKLLDVDFIIQKDNKTIVLDIKHMDESLRKCSREPLIKSNDNIYGIYSCLEPHIGKTSLYLKGVDMNLDDKFAYCTFDSTEEMNEYIKNMNKLIDGINNPVIEVDINKNAKYELGDNISISIYNNSNFISMKFYKYHKGIKTFYIDDKEEDGQSFDEVTEEFDNFCKRRNINAKLVR